MTQGQRAVVAALCHNLLQRGEPAELARSLKVPRQRVSKAIIITRHAPDLAEQVRLGDMPFQPPHGVRSARATEAERSSWCAPKSFPLKLRKGRENVNRQLVGVRIIDGGKLDLRIRVSKHRIII
jgi:hypothetical protein